MTKRETVDDLADEFVEAHRDKFRYSHVARSWLLREGKRWQFDEAAVVPGAIRQFLRDHGGATLSRISSVEKLARIDPRLAVGEAW